MNKSFWSWSEIRWFPLFLMLGRCECKTPLTHINYLFTVLLESMEIQR